ncbi:unnamed protein product, partial [Brassica rapa subsp. narinosa]
YIFNLPCQLTLFYNFIVSSSNICRWSLTISPPINFLTINISNRTIQHNTLFNFFPFPNLTIYMVRFKTKVSHIFHDLNLSTVSYADQPLKNGM